MVLTLLVLPAAYAMWRRHQVAVALAHKFLPTSAFLAGRTQSPVA
jgi:hypothetical protein